MNCVDARIGMDWMQMCRFAQQPTRTHMKNHGRFAGTVGMCNSLSTVNGFQFPSSAAPSIIEPMPVLFLPGDVRLLRTSSDVLQCVIGHWYQ